MKKPHKTRSLARQGSAKGASANQRQGKLIVTHAANFHPDDLFAVATLVYMLESEGYGLREKNPDKRIKIIRTLKPEMFEDVADYIVDIGGKHDPKKGLFDHHQQNGAGTRQNGIMYASFGLVWQAFGKKIAGSSFAFDWMDRHMVQGIDAMDTGTYLYEPVFPDVYPFLFESYIHAACDVVKADDGDSAGSKEGKDAARLKQFDQEFMRLLPIAKDALRIFIIKSRQKEKIARKTRAAYDKARDKRAIVSNAYIPTSFSEFKEPEYIQPLTFTFPDLRGNWSTKVVTVSGQSYDSHIKFPERWRGLRDGEMAAASGVPDAIFCHNSGFLMVAKSKEGALELVRRAFASLNLPPPVF